MNEIITLLGVRFRRGICLLCLFIVGFLTEATPGFARPARPFTFIQISDPQLGFLNGNEDFSADSLLLERVVARIATVKPDFVVVTGDMTNASRHKRQIACYQSIITKIPASIPVYHIPGNHDIGKGSTDDHIDKYISTFGDDHFFFTYQGCSFTGINSCVIKDQNLPREKAQFDWLSKVLHKKAKLKFVFAHHSFFLKKYDEKENYSNQSQEMRDKYWSLFKEKGVSCVIAGHLHDTKEASQDGIGMITCGPVGKPLGKGYSGIMVWTVNPKESSFTHRYLSIDEFEQTDTLQ